MHTCAYIEGGHMLHTDQCVISSLLPQLMYKHLCHGPSHMSLYVQVYTVCGGVWGVWVWVWVCHCVHVWVVCVSVGSRWVGVHVTTAVHYANNISMSAALQIST